MLLLHEDLLYNFLLSQYSIFEKICNAFSEDICVKIKRIIIFVA